MIIIAGILDVRPEERAPTLEASRELQARTRELPGCLDYVWSADPAVDGRVYVFERWQDEASLAAHFEGPLYWDMRKVWGRCEKLQVDVSKYRIDIQEAVYDDQGKARADFFTAGDAQ